MKLLAGLETSGIARRAFLDLGRDAGSCDILPAEDRSNRHIVCDIRGGILEGGWDLLAVMHPPCTRLCRSGRCWMSGPGYWTEPKKLPTGGSLADMLKELEEGVSILRACWEAPIERVAVAAPVRNDLTREPMPADRPAPPIVQPYWLKEPVYKVTGWPLRGRPQLRPTSPLPEPQREREAWRSWNAVHRMSPGPARQRLISRSFPDMIRAAAEQRASHAIRECAA